MQPGPRIPHTGERRVFFSSSRLVKAPRSLFTVPRGTWGNTKSPYPRFQTPHLGWISSFKEKKEKRKKNRDLGTPGRQVPLWQNLARPLVQRLSFPVVVQKDSSVGFGWLGILGTHAKQPTKQDRRRPDSIQGTRDDLKLTEQPPPAPPSPRRHLTKPAPFPRPKTPFLSSTCRSSLTCVCASCFCFALCFFAQCDQEERRKKRTRWLVIVTRKRGKVYCFRPVGLLCKCRRGRTGSASTSHYLQYSRCRFTVGDKTIRTRKGRKERQRVSSCAKLLSENYFT
ncbi:hypothetical protein B0T19DRAFT_95717 [Cercophora scortea]|uniref:Uncharacterized protein n=1 Tax=Cercophora scortea TaxID=314031 RepID=A0AAE0IVS4_9PEZI|nr:hypothetical protein B0T19DRAFT_95717 [Cercophora scortea]